MAKKKTTKSARLDSDNQQQSSEDSAASKPQQGVGDIADSIGSQQLEPNRKFLDAENQKKHEQAAQYAHLRDKLGYTFDPAIHITDAEGAPKLNKDNTLKRKRQRKKDSRSAATDASARALDAHSQVQARQAGVVAANTLIVSCRGLFGDEWQPVVDETHGIDERSELQSAFGDYFVAKGITDFPPGVALCMAVGMYAAPRFTKPKTQSRVKQLGGSIKNFFKRIVKRGRSARADNRKDKQRKDDTGNGAMPPSKAADARIRPSI